MIYAIIQARMGSSRLPGKVLMDLAGQPVLARVVDRVAASSRVDQVIVATTDQPEDNAIAVLCSQEGWNCYRGSASDVLDRYYQAAQAAGATAGDAVVRITADCPLIDPTVIDEVISLFSAHQLDYASNVDPPTFPDGLDVEVIDYWALQKAWEEADLISEREHVTPYIRNHKELFRQDSLRGEADLSQWRWTLDEPADYQFLLGIYTKLPGLNRDTSMGEILSFLSNHPDLTQINQDISRNEGYSKSLAAEGLKSEE